MRRTDSLMGVRVADSVAACPTGHAHKALRTHSV